MSDYISIQLPQKGVFNPNEISSLVIHFSEDLMTCKKDLSPMRLKPYWEKLFLGKNLQVADKLVYHNNGIELYLNVVRSIFHQHVDQTIKFTEVEEKLTTHLLLVSSVESDLERYSKTKKGLVSSYNPMALELLDRYLQHAKQLRKQVEMAPKDDPSFSLENMVKDELIGSLNEITQEISDRAHADISIEGGVTTQKREKSLKHPNFNEEVTALIEQYKKDIQKEVRQLEERIMKQNKLINILRDKVNNQPSIGNTKTLAIVGMALGAIGLLMGILGLVV